MFHTWVSEGQEQADTSSKRRTTTIRACEPCRKRKIRCNGEIPCSNCTWYKRESGCRFTEPRQRNSYSRRSIEQMQDNIHEYKEVFQHLFPNIRNPEDLKGLSRETLLELVAQTSPRAVVSPPLQLSPGTDERSAKHPDAAHLEHFQPLPEETSDGSESKYSGLEGITDDVNALSLSVKKSTSYLGISSVTAALRVILWLDPEAQTYFIKTPKRSLTPVHDHTEPEELSLEEETPKPDQASVAWDEIPLINAYFTYIHPIAPLLDEQDFRDTYMIRSRHDTRWFLLLNTVLALGSIADSSHSDEHSHILYWQKAKEHLSLETLGSAHIETVQALTLLSGLYLHYISEPTLAISLAGAAFRLATSLGLHRDYSEGIDPAKRDSNGHSVELRRRIWWSLFILDSWVGYGLGRPSMGRMNHAVSVRLPQETISMTPQLLTLVHENVRFCLISTRMEDTLAQSPIVSEAERLALDSAFVQWFSVFSTQNNTPKAQVEESHGISIAKNIMRWRYMLCRILLNRPVLLWAAMRRTPFSQLPEEKRNAVHVCREMTFELVNDIATTWQVSRPCSMSGWNATWLLYQALMVPLLHLFADRSDMEWNLMSQNMVETGIATFNDLRSWSQTASRSADVISRIYQASRRHEVADTEGNNTDAGPTVYRVPPRQQQTTGPLDFASTGAITQDSFMNDVFDSLNWSDNWVDESFPYTQAALHVDQGRDALTGMAGSYDPYMIQNHYDADQTPMQNPTGGQYFRSGYF